MVIKRKTVDGHPLSTKIPTDTTKETMDLSEFFGGIDAFCEAHLSGVVSRERFGDERTGNISISPEQAAYLLKLIVRLSGEDGRVLMASACNERAMLLMFKLSQGLPEGEDMLELCRVGKSAGFRVWAGEGAILAETDITEKDVISFGALTAENRFALVLNRVFFS